MRRVRALVQVDGEEREMEFLTNNLSWSADNVADPYRCRWQITLLRSLELRMETVKVLEASQQDLFVAEPLAGPTFLGAAI